MPQTLSLIDVLKPESMASEISSKYTYWQSSRSKWRQTKDELLKYLFATDTTHTSALATPWKNKTTRPKLCQIRDNLHANYINALFPSSNWLTWLPMEMSPEWNKKKLAILRYIYSKINHPKSEFYSTVSRLVLDYIDYGQVFAIGNQYTLNQYENNETVVVSYAGPKLTRLSPLDVIMDPSALDATSAPKIHRELTTLGDLHRLLKSDTNEYNKSAIKRAIQKRKEVRENLSSIGDLTDVNKSAQFLVAGFGTLQAYYSTDAVEILTFYGDLYDQESGKFYSNRVIKVVDKSTIIMNEPNWTTNGSTLIRTVGWRLRPDMLWAMGPLDNLVGLQYRIDHLENLRADAFDHIAFPTKVVVGPTVSEITGMPGETIYADTDSDVKFLSPDTTSLHADIQIRQLEEAMEEYAGAPRQAMGIRTPGEKTKFEVQTLENNAGRVFQLKAAWFESQFLEPLINDFIDSAVRNIPVSGEKFVYVDPITKISETITITKEDLNLKGVLRPMGARHFAEKANLVQNMTNLQQTMRPELVPYFDWLMFAKVLEEGLGVEKYGLVKDPQLQGSTPANGGMQGEQMVDPSGQAPGLGMEEPI